MNTSACTLQQWRLQANRALSSMLLDLPGTSKMRVRMEGCSLEVKIEFEIMAPEQSNISKKKSIPPSKMRRNRKRLENFLKKRFEHDGDGKSTGRTTENVEKTNLEISSEEPTPSNTPDEETTDVLPAPPDNSAANMIQSTRLPPPLTLKNKFSVLSDNDEREGEGEGTESDTTTDNQDEEYEDEINSQSSDNGGQHVTPPDSCDEITKVCNICHSNLDEEIRVYDVLLRPAGGWQCTALEECGIFFMCGNCYKYDVVRPHRHEMRWVNGPQRTKPREDKLPEDASAEYVPEEGANMALADGISTPTETERQEATDLDHKLKDSERKFVTVKRKKRKKRAKEDTCKTS